MFWASGRLRAPDTTPPNHTLGGCVGGGLKISWGIGRAGEWVLHLTHAVAFSTV